ncbi:aspartate carbamoyltransferase, partial [Thalassiosira pseudonana CCMP1335]
SPLISVSQITTSGLSLLFQTAAAMRYLVRSKGGDNRLQHRVLASVFYEASTRTSCSFQAAMMRLGGTFLHVDGGKGGNTSASKKGESLDDTIRCLECYTDVTVLRHPTTGSVGQVALGGGTVKPVINAGDGVGEHPTQALLDYFTIWDELGLSLNPEDWRDDRDDYGHKKKHKGDLIVVMLGDLKHGRTVHSLAKLLARSNLKHELVLRYCSPASLEMPSYVQEYVSGCDNVKQEEYTDMAEAVKGANVLYVTRVQKERFEKEEDYEKVKGAYVVDTELMEVAPSDMIVMHPLPRVDEISTDVDSDPRACYFRQMENGMFTRMAILALVLGKP